MQHKNEFELDQCMLYLSLTGTKRDFQGMGQNEMGVKCEWGTII